MGIINAIEDAAGAVVEGAKDMLGLGEEKVEAQAEAGLSVENTSASLSDSNETAETPRTYTVQAGDTLSKISQEFYGNGHDYMKIFEANHNILSDPDEIKVGQELVIP